MFKRLSILALSGILSVTVGCGSSSEDSTDLVDDSQGAYEGAGDGKQVLPAQNLTEIGVLDWSGSIMTGAQYGYVEGNWDGESAYTQMVIDGNLDVVMEPGKSYTLIVESGGATATRKIVVLEGNSLETIEEVYIPLDCDGETCELNSDWHYGGYYGLVTLDGAQINDQGYTMTVSFSDDLLNAEGDGSVGAEGKLYNWYDIPEAGNTFTEDSSITIGVSNGHATGSTVLPVRAEYVVGLNIDATSNQ